ncbi:hypothetical protein EZV62_015394 [Acer yangbiense]|uniref:CCHC-type domain-containing protein n=1 Tax=Acer yangbiense TaxID=1000413 RepID=A0A5C7HLA0_9ROSI|nr:hypothetical protein EZV62_015394 [Acer yangbiense]
MGSQEIERLCASLSLKDKEKEGPVHTLHGGLKENGALKMALCLAGKFLSPDMVNREAFRSVILRIWKLMEGVEVEVVTSIVFAFHFQLDEDRRKVLAGGPWSFDDALIVLEEPTGKGAIRGLKFDVVEFWVHISNLPLLCMTKEIAKFLGGIIGEVREIDTGPIGDCLGKFLRVRVAIDIGKPLRRFLRVDVLGDGEETVMPIQHERLPNFCFYCGMLGHVVRGCPEICKQENVVVSDFQYGSWLRVASPVKVQNRRGWGPHYNGGGDGGFCRSRNLLEEVRLYKQRLAADSGGLQEKSGMVHDPVESDSFRVGGFVGDNPLIREDTVDVDKRHSLNLHVDGLGPMANNEDGLNSIQTFAGGINTEMKRVIGPSGLGELASGGVNDPLSGRGSVLMIDKDEVWKSKSVSVKKAGQWKKAARIKAASESGVSPVLSSGKRKETVSADVFTEGTKRSKSDVSETDVVGWVGIYLQEFQSANLPIGGSHSPTSVISSVKWSKPVRIVALSFVQ